MRFWGSEGLTVLTLWSHSLKHLFIPLTNQDQTLFCNNCAEHWGQFRGRAGASDGVGPCRRGACESKLPSASPARAQQHVFTLLPLSPEMSLMSAEQVACDGRFGLSASVERTP